MAKSDENKYKQPQPNNAPTGNNGYPDASIKTEGVKARGKGAATKGYTSRGPMG